MKIQLIDKNIEMFEQWNIHFQCFEDVAISFGDIFEFTTDCIISPGNSFGFMDGGLDMEVSKKLGWNIEKKLRDQIAKKYYGELLIGQAELIETGIDEIPFFISAPTMRVPMILNDTVNIYLATRAVFRLLKSEKRINTASISGMGTGIGQVACDICARQMRKAYDDEWLGKYVAPDDFSSAQNSHQLLYSDEYRDLQY